MLQSPIVSVVIPTKNRKELTVRAIESVLKQESVNIEVIVVNDGSTDGTGELLKERYPHIKLINNTFSLGGAKSRNIGAESATAEYIAFLDSDDEWLPNHLISKLDFLKKNQADGVYGTFYLGDDQEIKHIDFYNFFSSSYSIADKIASFFLHDARTSTFLFRREAFMNTKFDEILLKHQDWDLAINFEKDYKLIVHKSPTVIIHVDSIHARMSNNLKHDMTLYFLNKNQGAFKPKSMFLFCIKMIMRCQAFNEKEAIKPYLQIIANELPSLTLKERLIYLALKNRLINLNTLREIRGQISTYLRSNKTKRQLVKQ